MARVYCMLGRLTFPRPRPWRPVHGDALFSAQLVSVGTRLTATHGATAEPLVPPPALLSGADSAGAARRSDQIDVRSRSPERRGDKQAAGQLDEK
jgi:hypothetical protein